MTQTKKKIIFFISVLALLFFIGFSIYQNNKLNNDSKSYKDDVRCYYCSKVIRADGRNIHGTPVYNGDCLECEYCHFVTSIVKY